jgi:hypothetical protein
MGTRKGAKGGKNGHKRHPRCIAIVASNDGDDEKANNSNEECIAAIERDFKHQTW